MPCSLLHVMEEPDDRPYADEAVKDVVGRSPKTFCARCSPIRPLAPHEMLKCLDREEPCWKPSEEICP